MKKILLVITLCLNLIILSSCAGGDVIVVEEKSPVTIRSVTMLGIGNPVADVYKEICEEFRAENEHVKLIDESTVSDEEWKKQIVSDFAAGNEPDVVQFFTDATANQLIKMDKFVTIEEIREIYPDYASDTYDWALKQVANQDGVMRAVPTTGFWEGLFCNKDLFDKYDIALPTDKLSFENAIRKFREAGIIPVACSVNNVPHYWMEYLLLSSLGSEEYAKPFSTVTPKWEAGILAMATLRRMGAFPESTDVIDNSYAQDLFLSKNAAMILEGNWFLSNVKDTENTIIMPFPGLLNQEGQNVIIGGMTSGFYISRRAWDNPDKRDAVVKFVMANTSKEAVERYWKSGGGITTTATEVSTDIEYNPLEKSAINYLNSADLITLSSDSRMEPEAYRELISGMLEVSNGGSASILLERVLELNNLYKRY